MSALEESARRDLYAFGMTGKYHSPDKSERMSACIDAFKAEVLREAAEKIRTEPPPEDLDGRFGPYINAWLDGQYEAADLIDPDKEGSADGAEAGRA